MKSVNTAADICKAIVLSVTISFCSLAAGCNALAPNEDAADKGTAPETEALDVTAEFDESGFGADAAESLSDAAKEQLRWENIKDTWPLSEYLDGLGHSVEYGLVVSPPTYTWYPDGTEKYSDGRATFLFSGPVWDENSVCVGISVYFDEILPDWTGETISEERMLRGDLGNIRWESASGEEPAHYVYEEGDLIFKLPASDEGKNLLTGSAISILRADAEAFEGSFDLQWRGKPLDPSLRVGEKWDAINKYAAKIGMSEEDIIAEIASGGPAVNDFGYNVYRDYATGDEYAFGSGECSFIYLTVEKVFPGFGARKEGADFLREINLQASWSDYEFAAYDYTFEDCTVYVFTDGDRNVASDYPVIVRD